MTKLYRLVLAISIATTLHFTSNAQSLSINTTAAPADPSAILDVTSTAKGMLIPRMDKTQKNAIVTPANGLLVFQTAPDSIGFHYYDLPNTRWVYINSNGFATDTIAWKLTGNSNVADTSFLGSINNKSLRLRYNNIASGQINDSTTYFGYKAGSANPTRTHNIGIGSNALQNNNATYNIAIGDSALYSNSAGGVTAIGYLALKSNAGFDNIAIGYSAMDSNTTGGGNIAIGNFALRSNNNTSRNTAVGSYAMVSNKANFGTAVGEFALTDNTTGSANTVVGSNALVSNKTGSANTALGTNTMFYNVTGGSNTVVGYQAMITNDSSSGNTAIGRQALYLHRGLNGNNTAVGLEAMQFDSAGFTNVAVGWRSLRNHKRGGDNVAIGVGALEQDSSGNNNTAVGRSAQFFHKRGNWNTSIGISSAQSADTAYEVTALGTQAAYYNKVPYITAVGTNALLLNNIYTNGDPEEGKENTAVGQLALSSNTVGTKNTAVGYHALNSYGGSYWITSSNRNTAVGDSAATATVAQDNVAVGYKALTKNFAGSDHVAVGSRALANTTATYPNTAVGYSSQDSNTVSGANTSVGSFALMTNKIGYNNTAIGNAAMMEAFNPAAINYMFDNTAVGNDALRFARYSGQTALGSGALRNDTAGIYNTAVGYLAMYENKTGTVNTALGTSALRLDTSGSGNVAVGVNALYNHRTGNNNVAMGYNTLLNSRDGQNNTAIGNYAMLNHKTNGQNTAVGYETMQFDTSGSNNAALGWRSLRYVKNGFENVALGVGAIEFSDSSFYNTAVGRYAMFAIGGTENTVVGYRAMGAGSGVPTTNYYTSRVTAIGGYAGFRNIAAENTFVGYNSGYGASADSLRGIENTALGTNTLTFTTTGRTNTAIGYGSLFNNNSGSGNIGVGTRTLLNSTTASYNVAIGDSALSFNNTGSGNIAIGAFANTSLTNLTNAIAIGTRALAQQNNSMVLGSINGSNGATATVSVGIGTAFPAARLHVRTGGTSGGPFIGNPSLIIEDNAQSYVQLSNPTANENGILSGNAVTSIRSGMIFLADSSIQLRSGGNINTMTLDNDNLVGIGTTAPTQKLHVIAPAIIRNAGLFQSSNAAAYSANGAAVYANNTYAGTVDVAAVKGTVLGTNRGYGVGGYFQAGYVGVWANVDNTNPSTGSFSTWGVYSTATQTTTGTNYGVSGAANGGATNIGVYGAAALAATTNYGVYGSANGGTTNWGGYFAGNVFTSGTYTPSDENLKSNIRNYEASALSKIMSLQTKSYNYDVAKYKYMNLPVGDQFGFLAQDLEKVFPQLVTKAVQPAEYEQGNKTGKKLNDEIQFKAVNYTGLIPVLTKAVQEQQQVIDKQQKQIDDLLKRVEKLEQK
jgi:trimeric autotransporter adhesin